jgi:hypothetical protein
MANLLEQAIECNNGDYAAKIIQHALGIESDDVAEDVAVRSRAAGSHHWGMVADRGSLSGVTEYRRRFPPPWTVETAQGAAHRLRRELKQRRDQ